MAESEVFHNHLQLIHLPNYRDIQGKITPLSPARELLQKVLDHMRQIKFSDVVKHHVHETLDFARNSWNDYARSIEMARNALHNDDADAKAILMKTRDINENISLIDTVSIQIIPHIIVPRYFAIPDILTALGSLDHIGQDITSLDQIMSIPVKSFEGDESIFASTSYRFKQFHNEHVTDNTLLLASKSPGIRLLVNFGGNPELGTQFQAEAILSLEHFALHPDQLLVGEPLIVTQFE